MKLCHFEAGLDQPIFLMAGPCVIESKQLALDTAGAWILHKLLARVRGTPAAATLQGLRPQWDRLLQAVTQHVQEQIGEPAPTVIPTPGTLERIGRSAAASW